MRRQLVASKVVAAWPPVGSAAVCPIIDFIDSHLRDDVLDPRRCLLPESDAVLPQRLPMVLSQVPILPPLVVAVFGAGACSQGLCTGAEWCWAAGSSVERRAVVSLLALCTRACCCVHAQRAFTSDKQRTCVSG